MAFQTFLLATGSTPAETSSMNIDLGFPSIAYAQQSLRLFPPLKTPALVFAYSLRSNLAIVFVTTSSTVSLRTPIISHKYQSESLTVKFSSIEFYCGQ